MIEPVISINGERQPLDGPHVSSRDRGVTLADGLFETMRARNNRLFRWEYHLARLHDGLGTLAIPLPPRIADWVAQALTAAGHGDARIRLTVTRGIGPPGLVGPADVQPTVIIAVTPLPDITQAPPPHPVSLHVASGRRNERAMSAGLKSLSYTDSVMAMLEAQRHGADDALFLDTEDHCSETTACNLFICTGGGLVTPPLSCGALPGIARAVVLELADSMGLPAEERAFGLDDLCGADEAFVTNSTRGPVAVSRVGDRAIGSGSAGDLTRRLADAYRARVLAECP